MEAFKDRVAAAAAAALDLDPAEIAGLLEAPRDPAHGDLALPCFVPARARKTNPAALARAAAERIPIEGPILGVAAAGPYLNFRLDPGAVAAAVVGQALVEDEGYGTSAAGRGQTVVVDFSSPNIAKPFGVHHLRSTVIGAALTRILRARGHDVVGINHLGDWGTQFGKLIVALRRFGDEAELERDGIPYAQGLYVRFNAEVAGHPELEDEARAAFRDLERGDPEMRRLWQRFRSVSEVEFRRVYEMLGIRFEHFVGESFFEDRMPAVVDEAQRRGLLKQSQDAWVIDLSEEGLGVCILRKKDDASLYLTRDLAAAIWRHETFAFHRCLYVVGAAQGLHFKQLFRILELLGHDFAARCVHVPFGLMRFKDRKMATRTGDILPLEDVLHRAVERSREIVAAKNPELAGRDEVARAVGVGAVVFNDLKQRRAHDVVFDWDEVLSFEGDTGPYLQYAHARIRSIFRKGGIDPRGLAGPFEYGRLDGAAERELVRAVGGYGDAVKRAAAEYEPSIVADHLLGVAAALNRFYIDCRILGEEPAVSAARLALARAAQIVLRNGLHLLGLQAPEEM